MSWQYEETEKLIQLYKNNTLLWDPDDPRYNNTERKRKAVREIARTLNKRRSSVTAKIRALRAMYQRMDKKINSETLKKGTYTGHVWSGYEPMSFLSQVSNKKSYESIDDSKSDMGDENVSDEFDEELDSQTKVSHWSHTDILKLIELYKAQPVLWDKEHLSFNNKGEKIRAIKQIAEALKKLAPEVRFKIKNLRTVFHKTHQKVSNAIKTEGKFTGKLWFGYRKLAFLNKDSLDICERINEDLDTTNNNSSEDDEAVSKLKWNREEMTQLIEMYKNSPALWDSDSIKYGSKQFRTETLEAFSRVLHKSRRAIEAKLRNLRTTFRRTHKMYCNPKGYKGKKWFAYKSLLFLAGANGDIQKPKPTANGEDEIKMELFSNDSNHSTYSSGSHVSEDFEVKDKNIVIDDSFKECEENVEAQDNSQRTRLVDEFTTFGDFVAQELRKLKDDYSLVEAKSEITNIIFNAQKNQMKTLLNNDKFGKVDSKDLSKDPLEIPVRSRQTFSGRDPIEP